MSKTMNAAIFASTAHLSTVGSAFIRNIIFARLLSPEDFGIAMTFGVVLLFVEYASNFGHENLMLRSEHGNRRSFQSTVHTTLIARGLLISAIIIFAAPYISQFFRLPDDLFDYAMLALVPFIRGFTHTDSTRVQRTHNHKPNFIINVTADASSIVFAMICASVIESYWAFYVSFVFRHCFGTLLSHLLAVRPYRLEINHKYALELLSFGVPLILLGISKYLGNEADKALIARSSGLEIFTSYLITMMFISNGATLVTNSFGRIFVRRISAGISVEAQQQAYRSNGVIALYLLLPISLMMCIFSESIITLVFGIAYHPVQYMIPIACFLTLIRAQNQWLNQIVVALFPTKILVVADITKLIGLATAVTLTHYTSDIRVLCLAFCMGELVYFFFLTAHLSGKHSHFWRFSLWLLTLSIAGMGIISLIYAVLEVQPLWQKIVSALVTLLVLTFLFNHYSNTCKENTQKLIELISNLKFVKVVGAALRP